MGVLCKHVVRVFWHSWFCVWLSMYELCFGHDGGDAVWGSS